MSVLDEDRKLCPDGACIGVIGDDGRCKVCGRAEDGSVEDEAAPMEDTPIAAADPFEDDDRRLCPDGSCIGVLGDDGRCKVCGASAS